MSTISEVLEKHTRPLTGDERLDSNKMNSGALKIKTLSSVALKTQAPLEWIPALIFYFCADNDQMSR